MPVISRTQETVYLPDGSWETRKIQTKVDAQGVFTIALPEHIAGVIEGIDLGFRTSLLDALRLGDWKALVSKDCGDVKEMFGTVNNLYLKWVRERVAKKVIQFTFKANIQRKRPLPDRNDISFMNGPALGLDYCVLWEIAGEYYNKGPDGAMSLRRDFGCQYIPHTDDREMVFRNMVLGLETLIDRIELFTENIETHTDAVARNGFDLIGGPRDEEE